MVTTWYRGNCIKKGVIFKFSIEYSTNDISINKWRCAMMKAIYLYVSIYIPIKYDEW